MNLVAILSKFSAHEFSRYVGPGRGTARVHPRGRTRNAPAPARPRPHARARSPLRAPAPERVPAPERAHAPAPERARPSAHTRRAPERARPPACTRTRAAPERARPHVRPSAHARMYACTHVRVHAPATRCRRVWCLCDVSVRATPSARRSLRASTPRRGHRFEALHCATLPTIRAAFAQPELSLLLARHFDKSTARLIWQVSPGPTSSRSVPSQDR